MPVILYSSLLVAASTPEAVVMHIFIFFSYPIKQIFYKGGTNLKGVENYVYALFRDFRNGKPYVFAVRSA